MENNKFYKIIRKLVRPITNFLWPVKIINANKFVEGKGIYVCNHFSMLDPVPFVTELFENNFNALMKEESMNLPIIGKILPKIGTIPIKREETDLRAIKKCMAILKNNEPLIIFPEGTRNKVNDTFLPFHEGSFKIAEKTGCPIIPMSINNAAAIFEDHLPKIKKAHVILEYGKPIYMSEMTREEKKKIGAKVQEMIKETYFKNKELE